jgi:hypothetical protein
MRFQVRLHASLACASICSRGMFLQIAIASSPCSGFQVSDSLGRQKYGTQSGNRKLSLTKYTVYPQVANVLWPLLDYSTNTANAESETLLEEGIRLMQAILSACPELPQPVQVGLVAVVHQTPTWVRTGEM